MPVLILVEFNFIIALSSSKPTPMPPKRPSISYSRVSNGYTSNNLNTSNSSTFTKVHHYKFLGRIYRSNENKSRFRPFITEEEYNSPFEQMGRVFKDNSPAAPIHRYRIIIHEGNKSHEFELSCKSGDSLPENQSLKEMWGIQWRGDIFVLRIGQKRPDRPVDMHGRDKARVNYAVRKLVFFIY